MLLLSTTISATDSILQSSEPTSKYNCVSCSYLLRALFENNVVLGFDVPRVDVAEAELEAKL